MILSRRLLTYCVALAAASTLPMTVRGDEGSDLFQRKVAPIFARRCLSCHNHVDKKGGLSLETAAEMRAGGDSGQVVDPGDPDGSYLLDLITPVKGSAEMPKDADPLMPDERQAIRTWIQAGAPWPDDTRLEAARVTDDDWWSLRPLVRPALPTLSEDDAAWVRTPVDAFIIARLREHGLDPSPEADRRTLIRRLYFDLIGLPPSIEEVTAFVNDPDRRAYEQLVERLLASPHYGERWARHWLDVVHYGDTHGYDKDKPRPHAWPYRDYVIRAFNDDRPYGRFIEEQIAGDVLFPESPDGIVATGFIAAGPWDFISHVEVPETKIDGRIARNLDRDDMVRATMETFNSITIGCARCHNHKFDPFTQRDYYQLQAVFAAVDRADRPFDADPHAARERARLAEAIEQARARREALDAELHSLAGQAVADVDRRIAELIETTRAPERPEFGYHSQISPSQDVVKWVQLDLGESVDIERIVYVGCHDNFNNIGAGFGFPLRYKVQVSDDPNFVESVRTLVDHSDADVPNPGVEPQVIDHVGVRGRYLRWTATKLAPRQNDYIFALAEVVVRTADGRNAAEGAVVTALDSIEAPVRWSKRNLLDGYYHGCSADPAVQRELEGLYAERQSRIARAVTPDLQRRIDEAEKALRDLIERRQQLPPPQLVYAAATHFAPQGNFKPTEGHPREIRILHRGNILQPGEVVHAGIPAALESRCDAFSLAPDADEGARRAALARWLAHPRHPLTWRTMANRVWLYHMGRGIVDSPNDFGRMGQLPTHPELLDWLAVELRDSGQSLKHLHRLICNSATYRQASTERDDARRVDSANQWMWRMNRRRLEAEAIRDAVLAVSGKLDQRMFGPGFQDFVIEKPEHSPHYEYELFDPENPIAHRRAIYRFIVRSQQQPFMTSLDCADPSMQVDKRNETVTPLQALALLNNRFMVVMARHFADRVRCSESAPDRQIDLAFQLATARRPTEEERAALLDYTSRFGLENTCRIILNLNEFVFVD